MEKYYTSFQIAARGSQPGLDLESVFLSTASHSNIFDPYGIAVKFPYALQSIFKYSSIAVTEKMSSKTCIVGKIVKSRMKTRKATTDYIRCEDYLNRDLRKAKEEEKWREKTNNREH